MKCLDLLREVETPENLPSLHPQLQLGSLQLADSCFSAAAQLRDPAAA